MELTTIIHAIALVLGVGVSIPIAVFSIECLTAFLAGPGRPRHGAPSDRPAVAVLVPAHDEEPVIAQTLRTLRPQLRGTDRLVVIADNCSDRTAPIARDEGAEVIERQDARRRGKGYALAFGVEHLSAAPPEIVIIVDADCDAHDGMIDGLACASSQSKRPTQAVYLLQSPPDPSPKDAISGFAFLVKNLVRPIGLSRWGLPCLLTGAGMGFPWSSLRKVPLASGNIVEDMQLGLDLAMAGELPLFCPHVRVTSRLPAQASAATSQRTRWEHGHLGTLFHNAPRLFWLGFTRGRIGLIGLALDLCVPPLSLLVMLWGATTTFSVLVALWTAGWTPVWLALSAGGLLGLAVVASWARYGRAVCSPATFLSLPFYLLWKIPMYFAFLFRPQKQWVRTARDDKGPK